MTLRWYHTSSNWKKWPSDFWALSYYGWKNCWPTKTNLISDLSRRQPQWQKSLMIVMDWLVKARLGLFSRTTRSPFRLLRFKDGKPGTPSVFLGGTLVSSLWGLLSLVTFAIKRVQLCGVQLWNNNVLLRGSNNCKLSVPPLQLKEKVPWTTQAPEIRKV